MKAGILLLLAVIPALAITFSCASSPPDRSPDIPFTTVAEGTQSGVHEPRQLVITNQSNWTNLWHQHAGRSSPPPAAPEIDFSKQSIVAVFAGRKRTGGYKLQIDKITKEPPHLNIHYTLSSPPEGAMTIQVLTSPFHIVTIPANTAAQLQPRFTPR